MKKFGLLTALTSVALVALSSCGGNNSSSKEVITLWAGGQWVQHDAENLKRFIDDYNSKHNDVEVKVTIKAEFETALASALLVNKQPDVVIWDRFNTPTYAVEGYLTSIDDMMLRDGITADLFQEQAYNELNYDNKQYGIPLDLDIWGIYVNMDLITDPSVAALVKEDWTWDDVKTVAHAVTNKSSSGFNPAGYSADDLHEHFFKYIVSTGTTDNFEKDGKLNYDTQEVRDVLDFFKNFGAGDVCNNDYNGKDAFIRNRLAMLNQPVYFSSYLKTYAPDLNYKFMPQPKYSGEKGKNGGMIGGFGMAIPQPIKKYRTEAWEKKKETSWNFIKSWLCNEETALEWSKASNTLPALKSLYSDEWIQNTNVLKSAASYADQYETRPSVPGFLNIQINVYNKYVKEYYKGSYSGSVDDLINELQVETDKIISRY